MSQEALLFGLLTFFVSVALAAWGLNLALAQQSYPGRISFVLEQCIPLFDTIVKNLRPELSVLYKERPVSENLVLVKGCLVNTGRRDISEEMVKDRLCLRLRSGSRWLDVRTLGASRQRTPRLEIEEDGLLLGSGFFRRNECIEFEALAEVPLSGGGANPRERLLRCLEAEHGIAETDELRIHDMPEEKEIRRRQSQLLPVLALLALGIVVTVGGLWFVPQRLYYEIDSGATAGRIRVRVTPQADGSLKVRGENSNYLRVVLPDEFFGRSDLKTFVGRNRQFRLVVLLYVVFLCAVLAVLLAIIYSEKWKHQNLRKLIARARP